MKVRALKLRDEDFGNEWAEKVRNHWLYGDFKENERWRKGWISFNCAAYDPDGDRVYCGITSFDSDIFTAYDRKIGRFVDLGIKAITDEYDAKFHRGLTLGKDGCLYAGIALLHCVDRYFEAPGGAVVRYDPRAGTIEKLGIPLPHTYIQSMALDDARGVVYGIGFHPQCLLEFDLNERRGRMLGLITSGAGGGIMSENIVIDDDGCAWSNWSLTRAWDYNPGPDAVRLCKYDPRADRIVFFQKGLPLPSGEEGYAPVESFANLGDGSLYAGACNGSLYRIDPATARAEYLCTPLPDRPSRLTSLAKTQDGTAYGICGRNGQCELIRFFYKKGEFEKVGPVKDPHGTAMWQCHHIIATGDGVLYACENDNVFRSSYLWEISQL